MNGIKLAQIDPCCRNGGHAPSRPLRCPALVPNHIIALSEMLSFRTVAFLFLAIFCEIFADGTDAKPTGTVSVTNAKRFAQGLPPLPPKRLFVPSGLEAATRARRSPASPGQPFSCGQRFAVCCTSDDPSTHTANNCDGPNSNSQTSNNCPVGTVGVCCSSLQANTGSLFAGSDCLDPFSN
ncbi:hypothetical protein CALCODRAFT_491189 [Calocera cornea HHB12733]|uniref:Hydrophobin n=1 Tax=Calocera cornea HHB12733 TaxID=1353952 RepID=A0A165J537_9BASI|nr:hypothetical protein CALCODRAFT_491189 [Calocera cornea HHB12733]